MENLDVLLSFADKAVTSGAVRVETWNKQQRKMRCLQTWLMCWVLSSVTIFIPVAHFFLVPLFFILGPVLGMRALEQQGKIISGHGECPNCNQRVKIEPGNLKWPAEELCVKCKKTIEVNIA